MCGRFILFSSLDDIASHFAAEANSTLSWSARYNIAPKQDVPVVIYHEGANRLSLMKWGLIPSWTKEVKTISINARAETIADKPSFKDIFRRRRCGGEGEIRTRPTQECATVSEINHINELP